MSDRAWQYVSFALGFTIGLALITIALAVGNAS